MYLLKKTDITDLNEKQKWPASMPRSLVSMQYDRLSQFSEDQNK